jgi:hypothetical protein
MVANTERGFQTDRDRPEDAPEQINEIREDKIKEIDIRTKKENKDEVCDGEI